MNAVAEITPVAALTPDSIVGELRHLPSAPKVLPRLKRLLQDVNASFEEIVTLIRLDPCIALRVLQVGNSAHFSRGERCVSVEEAIRRVGYDQVYELVSYAVASQVLVRPLDVYGIESEELWQRSVACALAADVLAERCGEDRPIAYTAGLLHAIGMVAIDEWALRNRRELRLVWVDHAAEYTASERRELGFNQAEVGAALLRSWDFPAEMWLPLRWQYTPAATAVQARLAAIICGAKWLRSMALGARMNPPLPPVAVLRMLRLTPEQFRQCLPEVRERLAAVQDLLQVEELR